MDFLKDADPAIFDAITDEENRQRDELELIASENYTSAAIMEAVGSVLTNKYAEGLPGKRYYGGCEFVDKVEQLAIDRVKELCLARIMPTSSPTRGPRPTRRFITRPWSQATPSWRWTWRTAGT